MGRRSQVDERLAQAFAEGETVDRAAERAGCSRSTAWRRWQDRAFKDRVLELIAEERKYRASVRYAIWGKGEKLIAVGLNEAQAILQNPNAADRDKLRAVQLLLDHFAPKQEPPQPHVPTAQQEQAAAYAARVHDELAQVLFPQQVGRQWGGNTPSSPVAPSRARAPAPILEDPDDDEDPDEAPWPAAAAAPAPEPQPVVERPAERAPAASAVPELVVPDPAELVPVDGEAEAWQWLRENPHRPPAGPELMLWLQARKVVGLDQEPQPARRRRQRRR